jgi:hypothetical protein
MKNSKTKSLMATAPQVSLDGPAAKLLREAEALSLSGAEKARLREAMRLEAGSKRDRGRAQVMVAAVRDGLGASLTATVDHEKARLEARLGEDLAAAAARLVAGEITAAEHAKLARKLKGEAASAMPDAGRSGPVRMVSRDGLASLKAARRLSEDQVKAGMVFRDAYEQGQANVRSQLGGGVGGGTTDLVAAGFTAARRGVARYRLERSVIVAMRSTEYWPGVRELGLLRMVAGEGRCLREFATGGKQFDLGVAALARALDAVALKLGIVKPPSKAA